MVQALVLTGVVFAFLAFIGAFVQDEMNYRAKGRKFVVAGNWTSLGISVILFLTAIWTYAITGG